MKVSRRFRIWFKKLLAPYRIRKWLFVDDMRNPPEHLRGHFDVVRDFDQFTEYIESYGIPRLISFDHDLHPQHTMIFYEGYNWCGPCESKRNLTMVPTGYDCAVWLVEHCERNNMVLGEVCVHSLNPVTAQRIAGVIFNHQDKNKIERSCRTIRWGIRDTRLG